ncbi:MAG: cysteine--tRNA ligase [Tissierellia bacterium]|nr:cysteine--tRNA ligase [Tissierellia bacterium]
MKVYNTLTRQKEKFEPLKKDKVGIYVCGPTVYNYIHVGNARPMVVFDTLRRYLMYKGYDVKYISNFTDIDDKIIEKAKVENVDFHKITEKYIDAYIKNSISLGFDEEDTIHPRATEFIPEMIDFVQRLEKKGAAYEVDGNVYFDVSKAKNYGALSKKNIEELVAGSRISVSDEKKNPMDFALWKKRKDESEPAWDSPWGPGRPGWHLECSVMSQTLLGDTIDIHAGGEDLSFPHHENEVAQSETLTNKPMAKYWMHNGMITVDNEKMSKSKGNFFLLNDIEKKFDLEIVRMWLLGVHYRNPINFSEEVLIQSQNGLERLYNGKFNVERLLEKATGSLTEEEKDKIVAIDKIRNEFEEAMDDDLNTADGLTAMYELIKYANIHLDENSSKEFLEYVEKAINDFSWCLGILWKEKDDTLEDDIERLIAERSKARKNKDFETADRIRDQLLEQGIVLKDTRDGVLWEKK